MRTEAEIFLFLALWVINELDCDSGAAVIIL